MEAASVVFGNTKINLTLEGTWHLGGVIGKHPYERKYVNELVTNLNNQLWLLSKIAETKPQSAYAAFVTGFKGKLTYFIHTIPNISELLLPLEHNIRQKIILSITGSQTCSDNERILLSLPTQYGGLNLPFFHETANFEYKNFSIINKQLTNINQALIINQDPIYTVNSSEVLKLKSKMKAEKEEQNKNILLTLEESFRRDQKRLNEINREKGVSNWLLVLSVVESGFDLIKQQFWNSIRLRYGWSIANLPTACACGSRSTIQHCISWKKEGFMNIRQNDVRDLTVNQWSANTPLTRKRILAKFEEFDSIWLECMLINYRKLIPWESQYCKD